MAVYVSTDQGIGFQMGGGDSRRLISADMGAHLLTMNYSVFQPGQEFPQHFHDSSVDIFIVLEGGVSVRQSDVYTPIKAGDFAYIPAGEVHGTVNQTDAPAILISFQAPPDLALYRGERDSSATGKLPMPPYGHVSKVRIDTLRTGAYTSLNGAQSWVPVSSASGSDVMMLVHHIVEPDAVLVLPDKQDAESVCFVWSGEVSSKTSSRTVVMPPHTVAFISPGEQQTIMNTRQQPAHLICCLAGTFT